MTNDIKYSNLYSGISKVAWGYIFLFFDFNLGTVSILPDFVGYLLFLSAIGLLQEEEAELALLKPFGTILVLWSGAEWIASWFTISFDDSFQIFSIIICIVSIYFQFQMLTNLASIAAKYQSYGMELDKDILRYRTIQTIMITGTMIFTYITPWLDETWLGFLVLIVAGVSLLVGICLIGALFKLRKIFL